MKNSYLQKISELTGASKSTVSKVLNHCSGIDSETRQRILATAHAFPGRKAQNSRCDIYFILPDVPHYFWDPLRKSLISHDEGFTYKYNIYTKLHDPEILHYIEEAKQCDARVVIAAADGSNEVTRALFALSGQTRLFLISEYVDLPNAFYFGSDAEADGKAMGAFFASNSFGTPVIIRMDRNINCERRIRGFLEASGRTDAKILTMPKATAQTFPSKMAALLYSLNISGPLCLYCTAGNVDRIMLAAAKAGVAKHTVILGQDVQPQPNETFRRFPGVLAARVNQDIAAQGAAALAAAQRYLQQGVLPAQKYNYIPSDVHFFKTETGGVV